MAVESVRTALYGVSQVGPWDVSEELRRGDTNMYRSNAQALALP